MKFRNFLWGVVLLVVVGREVRCTIIQLLRNNVAGPAVNFQTFEWPVDPNAGLRRRKEYEALNGRYGYKHVERIGLGEDGKAEERRLQQRYRDQIGALSYQPGTGYGR